VSTESAFHLMFVQVLAFSPSSILSPFSSAPGFGYLFSVATASDSDGGGLWAVNFFLVLSSLTLLNSRLVGHQFLLPLLICTRSPAFFSTPRNHSLPPKPILH